MFIFLYLCTFINTYNKISNCSFSLNAYMCIVKHLALFIEVKYKLYKLLQISRFIIYININICN